MNEMTEAGRDDGRSTNGTANSPIKGVWYDTESFGNVDQELAELLELAE